VHDRAALLRTLAALSIIGSLTILAYAASFEGQWISDDVTLVAEEPTVHSLSPENLRAIATSRTDGVNYMPLNFLSIAIDYHLWGPSPAGFHLTNLVIHLANAFAIYFLLLRLRESVGMATAAALLWSLHPVQVETVAWISERKNVLSTLFLLLAFHTYLRYSARPRLVTYLGLVGAHLAALLSKVNTIVLPALTLAHELVWHGRLRARTVLATIPLFACGFAVAFANLHGNTSHGAAYHGGSLAVTMRTSSTTIPRYLWNAVAPFDLSYVYEVPLRASWTDPPVVSALCVIAGLVALTCWLAWRRQPDAFWLAWFGITLSPMLNLVPFPALMNDRYLYVPLLGLVVPILRLGRRILDRIGAAAAAPWVVGSVACGLGVLTMQRVPVFRNELNLWADGMLKTCYITADQPWGPPPRQAEKRMLEDERQRYPERACLYNNLGGFAFEDGRFADALPLLTRAAELDPAQPTIALNLGRTQLALGRNADAIRTLELATTLEPPSFFAQLNLARAYLRTNDLARARAILTTAKTIKPHPNFWLGFEQQLSAAEQRAS